MRVQPISLVGGSYADETRPWSQQDTVNYLPCLAESSGTRSGEMLKTPPGLYPHLEIPGAGPVRGTHNAEGKFFAVIGSTLYLLRGETIAQAIGSIPGIGRVSFTHNQISLGNQVVVVNGSAGYVYDTVTGIFGRITDSGFPGAATIGFLDSYIVGVEPHGRYAFNSRPANAYDYNTVDRFTSEVTPDRLVGQAVSNNELLLFSTDSCEFFENSGESVQPFRTTRTTMDKGCAGAYTIIEADNTVFWLGSDGYFYRLQGYSPVRISKRPLEQAIRGLNWSQAYAFLWEDAGHTVIYWTFPDGRTWGYDAANNEWHRRESYRLNRWRPNTMTRVGSDWLAGDFQSGRIWRMDWAYPLEGDQEFISERTCAVMHDNQNAVLAPRLELVMDTGQDIVPAQDFQELEIGPQISGQAPDGIVGQPYPGFEYTVTAGSSPVQSVNVLTGAIPTGLTIDTAGEISAGTPTQVGVFPFTLRARDANSLYADLADSINITAGWVMTVANSAGTVAEGHSIYQSADLLTWNGPYARSPSPIDYPITGPYPTSDYGILVAGSGSTIERSTDLNLSDGMTITSATITGATTIDRIRSFGEITIAISAVNESKYWTSSDRGGTWTQRTAPTAGWIRDVARLASGRWVAVLDNGPDTRFIYSDDSGEPVTWTSAMGGAASSGGCIACNGRVAAYHSTSGRIYRTEDGGVWTLAATLGAAYTYGRDATQSGDTLLIASEGVTNSFVRSLDDGITWDRVSPPLQAFQIERISQGDGKIAVSFPEADLIVGIKRFAAYSTDSGDTWQYVPLPAYGAQRARIAYRSDFSL